MEDVCQRIMQMRTSNKILTVVVLIALTNLMTFVFSSRFQRMAIIDEDDFDFNIYDSIEYSSSYTGERTLDHLSDNFNELL